MSPLAFKLHAFSNKNILLQWTKAATNVPSYLETLHENNMQSQIILHKNTTFDNYLAINIHLSGSC